VEQEQQQQPLSRRQSVHWLQGREVERWSAFMPARPHGLSSMLSTGAVSGVSWLQDHLARLPVNLRIA